MSLERSLLRSGFKLNGPIASPISEHASVEAKEAELRHQESALVKLGELYRDQKCVLDCG